MATPALAAPAAAPGPQLYRLSVEQYHRMIASGVLRSSDRTELLDGFLVCKMTQHPPHAATLRRLLAILPPLLPADWLLQGQSPITLAQSQPEPDIAVVQGPHERYFERHPGAGDIALVIEVADTSLEQDRGWKQEIYARARTPTYWIVNLLEQQLEVHTRPVAGRSPRYRDRGVLGRDASVSVALGETVVGPLAVSALLPPA